MTARDIISLALLVLSALFIIYSVKCSRPYYVKTWISGCGAILSLCSFIIAFQK